MVDTNQGFGRRSCQPYTLNNAHLEEADAHGEQVDGQREAVDPQVLECAAANLAAAL